MSIKQIQDRLEELYLNKPMELDELLDPELVRCDVPHNLVIEFPGFVDWIQTFDKAAMAHISAELKAHRDHALKNEIHKYKDKKQHYEEQINKKLGRIGGLDVGVAVFAEIRRSRKWGFFRPFILKKQVNADAWALDGAAATAVGMPIYRKNYVPRGSGMGAGSDCVIDYTPDMFGVFNNLPRKVEALHGPGSEADEILLHELVHACREMTGHFHQMPVSGHYGDAEEYIAVVITNIYLSNKGQTAFRKNHRGHETLPDPMNFLDSTACNMSPRTLIERLRLHQPALYNALAAIPKEKAPFNPIRWYENERTQKKAA